MTHQKKLYLPALILATFLIMPAFELLSNGPAFFFSYNFSRVEVILFFLLILNFLTLFVYLLLNKFIQIDRSLTFISAENIFVSFIFSYVFVQALNRTFLLNKMWYLVLFLIFCLFLYKFLEKFGFRNKIVPFLSFFPFIYLGLIFLYSPTSALILPEKSKFESFEISENFQGNVYLLIIDELALGPMLNENLDINDSIFPNFSRLQEKSTWYTEFKTVASNTLFATPAIFSGLNPQGAHADPTAINYPRSVFTALAKSFEIHSFEPYTRVCPIKICGRPGLDVTATSTTVQDSFKRSIRRYRYVFSDLIAVLGNTLLPPSVSKRFFPNLDGRWSDFYGLQVRDSLDVESQVNNDLIELGIGGLDAIEWKKLSGDLRTELPEAIQLLEPTDSRSFWMIHWVPPHGHDRSPDGTLYSRSLPYEMSYESTNPHLQTLRRQQYVLQTMYVDKVLGDFMDKLITENLWDQSLIVVTSDHGMSFAPGDRRGRSFRSDANPDLLKAHSVELIDTLPIPLFIKFPNQTQGQKDLRTSSIVDIFPTILFTLGINLGEFWPVDGRPLQELDGDREIFWHHMGDYLEAHGVDFTSRDARDKNFDFLGKISGLEDLYSVPNPDFGKKVESIQYVDSNATFKVHKLEDIQKGNKHSKSNLELFEAEASALVGLKDNSFALIAINDVICGKGPVYKDTTGMIRVESMLNPECILEGKNNSVRLLLNLTGEEIVNARIVEAG